MVCLLGDSLAIYLYPLWIEFIEMEWGVFRLGITCYCAVETVTRQDICDGIGIEYFFTQHPVW